MKDTELYTKILGIKRPWYVKEVRYKAEPERIDIYVDHERGIQMLCPECDEYCPVYDHMEEREWQHMNTCQVPTFIHTRLPRIKCREHGVKCIISEWSEPGSDMTMRFESYLIDLEKECSLEGIRRLTGVSWDRLWGVMHRSVKRGLERKEKQLPKKIGIDEKSFARRHKYETLVYDIEKKTVEYVVDTRRQEALEEYYNQFSKEERAQIEVVTMDMWDPYIAATKAYVPGADEKIVFDKFHIMRMITEAVDRVRKEEHGNLIEQKNECLKGTKYLWLYSRENIPEERYKEFKNLQRLDLKVGRAWSIKENFRKLWEYKEQGWAIKFFKKWYFWATHSKLKSIIKVAKTIKRRFRNILTYLKHKITNSLGEALNSQIEKIINGWLAGIETVNITKLQSIFTVEV